MPRVLLGSDGDEWIIESVSQDKSAGPNQCFSSFSKG